MSAREYVAFVTDEGCYLDVRAWIEEGRLTTVEKPVVAVREEAVKAAVAWNGFYRSTVLILRREDIVETGSEVL